MSFGTLSRCPIPHDADAGLAARQALPDIGPELGALVEGAAGCSPYLAALMQREHDWLPGALSVAPDRCIAHELQQLECVPLAQLGQGLRRAKRRVALIAALADLGGVWALHQVTGALTDLADAACARSLNALVSDAITRGKLPGMDRDTPPEAAGMVVLAMGKMGARELNYSSDIDLICLFDDTKFADSDIFEARAAFIRVTRILCGLLSDYTEDGYVFRTDLRLRPDPSVTPVCLSMDAAERYYESLGRTWERAAYIKARPCAGDIDAGLRFLETLRPFVWRRHMDFAAIQDAHDMRLRIRSHKGLGGALALEGHDLKLGQGGIREIEFFTQTRQLIAGGRDPELRSPRTVEGLAALATKGWVPQDVTERLSAHYIKHREIEHRLQMVQDAQTQTLPKSPEGFARLAHFMGQRDVAAFRDTLRARLVEVGALTEGFFTPDVVAGDTDAPEPEFSQTAQDIISRWHGYPALRSDRGRGIFRRLRPVILQKLHAAADPEEALIRFDSFLSGLPAGVQLFSLFEANPQLIDLIVDICATAPRLASYLSRNAAVLDAVIGGGFFAPWPSIVALTAELSDRLAAESDDYERQLDSARIWAREWHFRIGVHHLRGLVDAFEAGTQYAALAEACLAALWPVVCAQFATKHGAWPGQGACVVAMGSLGAGRLNAASDLDLIVIYDADPDLRSDGPRPLDARSYYARLTKAFLTATTAPTAEGRLYEVDMRLRPSGRQGPVATSLKAFCDYQRNEAWTWEHLALTRARRVAGSVRLGEALETFRRDLLAETSARPGLRADTAKMRARLAEAKPSHSIWDAKSGPGRLMDIELAAQLCALIAGAPARRVEMQLTAGRKAGIIDAATEAVLQDAFRLCWRMQATGRLLADEIGDIADLGPGAQSLILREAGATDTRQLAARLEACGTRAAKVISALMEDAPPAGHKDNSE